MPKTRADRTLPKGLHEKPIGSGNFYSTFYDASRQPKLKWIALGTMTLEAAEIAHRRLRTLYSLSEYDPWAPRVSPDAAPGPSQRLLSEAVAAFLAARSGLAPATIKEKRYALGLLVKRLPQRRRVGDVTPAEIERFLSRPTLKTESSRLQGAWLLSAFFDWCIAESFCTDNPARSYIQARSKNRSAYDRQRMRPASRTAVMPDDLRLILSELQMSRQAHLVDAFLFAVSTGVRRGELCAINRRDVTIYPPPLGQRLPVTGQLHVRNWDDPRTGRSFRTKNGKARLLPMTPLAVRIAARQMAAQETEDPYAPLFRAVQGGRLIKQHLSRDFRLSRLAVGLPESMTFHSLRHAFASYLLMLSANVLTIKRLLGHSTLAELDRYAELCESYLMGDARPVQRLMLTLLCPDLPTGMLDRLLPSRRSMLGVLSATAGNRAQHLQAIIPIEDVLFSGLIYETEAPTATRPFFRTLLEEETR